MRKVLFILMLTIFPLASLHAETLKINFDDWCPHYCANPENPQAPAAENPGYQLEIINSIFKSRGYDFSYQKLPWARAVKEAKEGRLDALMSPAKDEAPELFFPDEEIGILGWCFYTKQESKWSYEGADSLKEVMLGFLQGNDFGGEVQAYIEWNKDDQLLIQPDASMNWIENNFERLSRGRITAILDEPFAIDYFIKTNDLSGRFRKAGCLESQKMYMAFSPKNPNAEKYAEIFDSGIQDLRASGELDRILSDYGLTDWR